MAKSVWKFGVAVGDPQRVEMPGGARVLHVEHQSPLASVVTFWAEVEPEKSRVTRTFVVIGTGHFIPSAALYIGTDCVSPDLVWHLYEIPFGEKL